MTTRRMGDIDLGNGRTFRWILTGDKTPEIYGWVEVDYEIVNGTSGWYRTPDAEKAAQYVRDWVLQD